MSKVRRFSPDIHSSLRFPLVGGLAKTLLLAAASLHPGFALAASHHATTSTAHELACGFASEAATMTRGSRVQKGLRGNL